MLPSSSTTNQWKNHNYHLIYVILIFPLIQGYMSEKNFKYKMLCYPKKGFNTTKKHNIMMSNRLNKKQNQEKYIDRLKIKRFLLYLKSFQI
jgi:hypothetical protein